MDIAMSLFLHAPFNKSSSKLPNPILPRPSDLSR